MSVLAAVDPRFTHQALEVVPLVLDLKRCRRMAEVDGLDTCRAKRGQLTITCSVLNQHPEPFEYRVTVVDETVLVLVVGGEVGESVSGLGAEQFEPIIHVSITIAPETGRGLWKACGSLLLGISTGLEHAPAFLVQDRPHHQLFRRPLSASHL